MTTNPQIGVAPWEPRELVGTTLDGRYELTAHLATGGMGAVFRARHVPLRKDVAVKVMRPDLTCARDLVERFRQEAEIAARLEHENIVRVTDFGRSPEGYLFLVMELLEGESLFERLRREVLLPPEEAVPIFWQICSALEAAHALNVVHRDLKPENVFIARFPDGREVVKILDFGIAKFLEPTASTATAAGMVVGTPEYLSPEQAVGGEVDGRADLYSVGIIAWRTLVGRHPFLPNEPRALIMAHALQPLPPITDDRPELAVFPALVAAVARACAKEIGERHPNATALKDDFAASIGPLFVPPPPAANTLTPGRPLTVPPISKFAFDLQPPTGVGGETATATPEIEHSPTLERQFHAARLRKLFGESWSSFRALAEQPIAAGRSALYTTWGWLRGHPALLWGAVALAVAFAGGWFVLRYQRARIPLEVQRLVEEEKATEARDLLRRELAHRPAQGDLQLLLGHVSHHVGGRELGPGIEAYAAAYALGFADDEGIANLVDDLGRDAVVADKSSHLLFQMKDRALPAILGAVGNALGPVAGKRKLAALTLARDLGAEDRVDRTAAYVGLLKETNPRDLTPKDLREISARDLKLLECEVRRAAIRRLGELGDPAALPALRERSKAVDLVRVEKKGYRSSSERWRACDAADADAAIKRIEALQGGAPR